MPNIKMTVAYDGTNYLGWQKTATGSSIEAELERVLTQILSCDISLQAASRTDAGVHASGQVVNFISPKMPNLSRLKLGINSLLPKDIAVLDLALVDDEFHPTLHSRGKEYHYHLCFDQVQQPHLRHYAWHYPRSLDLEAMREAAKIFIGEHDFSAFCNFKKNCRYTDFVRNIFSINIIELPQRCLRFEVCGNHFLYKMVRNLIGTLAYVGEGKIALSDVQGILQGRNRTLAGVTAPAHGLFLYRIIL